MTHTDTAWQAAEDAAEAVGPEAGLLASPDMASFGESLLSVLTRAAAHPVEIGEAGVRFWTTLARIGQSSVARSAGSSAPPPIHAGPDKRFTDPAWEDNPGFFALRQAYLAARNFAGDVLVAGHGDPVSDGKAELALGFLLDASSPTNFLLTNPAALKRAFGTGGGSVLSGARNFLDDLANNGGRPSQVDTRSFELGRNLAATPGKVVYKSDLMELIQYAPQTPKVRAIPMLMSPAWINKYYVMDLAPGRSFIEWAVQHGHTVFAI